VGLSAFEELSPWTRGTQFDDSNATADKAVFYIANRRVRLDLLLASSDDTVDQEVIFGANLDAGDYVVLGSVPIPAGAGFGGVPPVNILPSLGYSGDGIVFSPDVVIQAHCTALMSSGKFVYLVAWGATLPS
jgi:hypothetical protein